MPKEKYNVQEGLKKLRTLIPQLVHGSSTGLSSRPTRMFYQEGLGGLTFDGELAAEYERVLQQLTPDEETGLTRTRGETDKLLSTGVLKALDIREKQTGTTLEQRIGNEIKALKDQLTAPLMKWKVWRRIHGLKIPTEGFQFGQVWFCGPQHETAKATKAVIEAKIDAMPPTIVKWHRENLSLWSDSSDDAVLCRVEVQATGGESARHLAKVELDAAFPILNLFASFVTPRFSMPTLALQETSAPRSETDFALGETGLWHWQMTTSRIVGSFDVAALRRNESIWNSVQKANAMLQKPGNDKFGERLLSAMKWAGKGAVAQNKDEAFLFYAIALESLILGGRHNVQLSYRLRLRVGQVLGRKKPGKMRLRDVTQTLYDVRNAIAHNGKTDVASVDLDDLRYIFESCFERILCHDEFAAIATDDALEAWFEDALMNEPSPQEEPATAI